MHACPHHSPRPRAAFLRVAAAAAATDTTSAAAMTSAFAVFDPAGTGSVSTHTLRTIFGALGGAPLPAAGVDGLAALGDPGGTGSVDYAALVAHVFADADAAARAARAAELAAAAAAPGKGAKRAAPAGKK